MLNFQPAPLVRLWCLLCPYILSALTLIYLLLPLEPRVLKLFFITVRETWNFSLPSLLLFKFKYVV